MTQNERMLQHMAQACRQRLRHVHKCDMQTLVPTVRLKRAELCVEFWTGAVLALNFVGKKDEANYMGTYVRDKLAHRAYEKTVELSNGIFDDPVIEAK